LNASHVIITRHNNPLPTAKGLCINECECGAHVWALPHNDELARWESHQQSRFRDLTESKGMAPPEPRISHHVVLASPEDADLLRARRWRVYPSKTGTRHKVELRGGTRRGLPLQRHIMGREECVRVVNGYGCDVRRENLKRMTRKEITADRRARKTAQKVLLNAPS